MSNFEALRQGFSELNRMLTDKQQWEERHSKAQADRDFNHVMLQSQIEQQSFNRRMATKTHALAERGADLAASRFKEGKFGITNKRAADTLSNTIRHQEVMEGQGQTIINENAKKTTAYLEKHRSDMKKQDMEIDRMLFEHDTTNFTINDMGIDPEILANPEYRAEINQQYHLDRFEIGEDGNAVDTLGGAFMLKRYEQVPLAIHARAIAEKYDTTKSNAIKSIEEINNKIVELENQKNQVSHDGGLGQHQKAMFKRQQNKLEGAALQIAQVLTPKSEMDNLIRRADNLRAGARKLDGYGALDQANNLREDAKGYEARADSIRTAITAEMKAGSKSGKTFPGEMNDVQMTDFTKEFEIEGMQAMYASHAAKALKGSLKELSTSIYLLGGQKGQEGGRLAAHTDTFSFYKEQESEYWSERDSITALSNEALGPMVDKSKVLLTDMITKAVESKEPNSRKWSRY